jgi:hypothetical protein
MPGWPTGTARPIPGRRGDIGRDGSSGGETGIRTLGTLSRTHAFQACALSRSAISPAQGSRLPAAGPYQTPEPAQTLILIAVVVSGWTPRLAAVRPFSA